MRRDLTLAAAGLLLVLTAGLSLTRVFSSAEWQAEAVVAGLLATGIAVGVRRIGAGPWASAAGSVTALVVFTYIVHLPSGPLVPGLDELRAALDLVRDGLVQVREVPAPTAPLDGLRILVTSGTWVIALVVHELLVRGSRPGGAVLAASALWIVPLAVPLPPSATWPTALPFLAAAGLVLALEPDGDDRGRRRESEVPVLTSTAAVVGAAALAIAGLAPGLLPGYGAQPWVDIAGAENPRGYQPIVDVGDRLQLPVDRDVLEVRTTTPSYLRLAALDTFDGSTWRLGPSGDESFRPEASQLFGTDGPLPYEAPIEVGEEVVMDVQVLDLENIYVPLPYQVDRIVGPRGSRMFYSLTGGFVATGALSDNELRGQTRVGVTPGFRYQVEAVVPSPSYDELVALGDPVRPPGDPTVQLPADYGEFADLARQVYDEAGATTTIDRVLALQDLFIGSDSSYRYDTDVPQLRGDSALRSFVFETQVGYCEYFSTAMALMLRATGIPARVAVGFLPGRNIDEVLADGDVPDPDAVPTYRVSTGDAHAWVEVLFEGYGWVRMDPTPRSDGSTYVPTSGDLTPSLSEAQEQALADSGEPVPLDDQPIADSPDLAEDLPPRPTEGATAADDGAAAEGTAGAGGAATGVPWVVALLGLVGLGIAGAAVRRRRLPDEDPDPLQQVLDAQRLVLRRSAQLGLARGRGETLPEVLRRWVREGRIPAAPASELGHLGQAAAFGGPLPQDAGPGATAAAAAVVEGLEQSVAGRDRALAPVRVPLDRVRDRVRPLVARLVTRDRDRV